MVKMVQIVCHKGANRQRPENTFASAQLCVDWGVDYVEVDVNTSADVRHPHPTPPPLRLRAGAAAGPWRCCDAGPPSA